MPVFIIGNNSVVATTKQDVLFQTGLKDPRYLEDDKKRERDHSKSSLYVVSKKMRGAFFMGSPGVKG